MSSHTKFEGKGTSYTEVIRRCMNKYGPKATKVIEKTMSEYKHGKLKSGQSGKKVKDRDQAIAIGISKAKKSHYKVPVKSG